ncbi:hypothetical protein HOH87_05155 [bacterium]|jgi:hypothetical protein|nr:hypothetical protein [bacterium]
MTESDDQQLVDMAAVQMQEVLNRDTPDLAEAVENQQKLSEVSDIFSDLFAGRIKSLMVTNHGQMPSGSSVYYARITDEKMLYLEESKAAKNQYELDIPKSQVLMNGDAVEDTIMHSFMHKLNKMTQDIQTHSVMVLEEHK